MLNYTEYTLTNCKMRLRKDAVPNIFPWGQPIVAPGTSSSEQPSCSRNVAVIDCPDDSDENEVDTSVTDEPYIQPIVLDVSFT